MEPFDNSIFIAPQANSAATAEASVTSPTGLDNAIQDQPNQVDQALNASAPAAAPTFDDHLAAFSQVLQSQIHGYGTSEDRWDPLAAGSIARRDYYDLGAQNVSANSTPKQIDYAAGLNKLFSGAPESALINADVNPTGPARQDMRFANFPTAPRSIVAPIRPGQYSPGNLTNKPKVTPATMPQAFSGQTPVALDVSPIKTLGSVRKSIFPQPPR